MNIKESIEIALKAGCTISMPYKSKINDWYGKVDISLSRDEDGEIYYTDRKAFTDKEDGINHFCTKAFSSKNIGYIQSRLHEKNLLGENSEHEIEYPTSRMENLFKEEAKLIDEEFEKLNIVIKPLPLKEDAIKEIQELVDNFDVNTFQDKLYEFKRKYISIDVYIGLSFVFETVTNGSTHDFSTSFDIKSFNKKIKSLSSEFWGKAGKFKNIRVSFRVDNSDFIFYDIKYSI